jgi:hypothetical protein
MLPVWLTPSEGEARNGHCRHRLPLRDRLVDGGELDLSAGHALPQMAWQAPEANQLELVLSWRARGFLLLPYC